MSHVAIVSHDAGGAEILSSWLNRNNCPASIVVAGPAISIFRRKCPKAETLSLDDALAKSTWILCGTGWQSSFERLAIARGRVLGKKTVAFLDHWVNYRERFQEGGGSVLPDEIWVGDLYAERLARAEFPETPVSLKPNPYFEDLLVEIEHLSEAKCLESACRVLYVCEPVADHSLKQYGDERYLGYTEHDALRFFLDNLNSVGQPVDAVTIRPHPSEQVDKYNWASDLVGPQLKFGGELDLLGEILTNDIIVGCESMAMVVGILAGKRVISSIPPGGRLCQLPHHDIEYMTQLLKGSLSNG